MTNDTEYRAPLVYGKPWARKFISARSPLEMIDAAMARQEAEEAAQQQAPEPRTFQAQKTARGGQVIQNARDERLAQLQAAAEERERERMEQRAAELALLASLGAVITPRAKQEPVASPDTAPGDLLARMKAQAAKAAAE